MTVSKDEIVLNRSNVLAIAMARKVLRLMFDRNWVWMRISPGPLVRLDGTEFDFDAGFLLEEEDALRTVAIKGEVYCVDSQHPHPKVECTLMHSAHWGWDPLLVKVEVRGTEKYFRCTGGNDENLRVEEITAEEYQQGLAFSRA